MSNAPNAATPAQFNPVQSADFAAFLARANPSDPSYDRDWAAQVAQQSLQQMAQPQPSPRDHGRFTPGNPGGPGRPRKIRVVEEDVLTIIANSISDQDWADMTQAAVQQAIEGDSGARRWLYQMLFKNSRATLSDAAAAHASGLTDNQRRLLLAQERYGEAMQALYLAEQELKALEARAAQSQRPALEDASPTVPASSVPAPAPPPTEQPLEVRLAPQHEPAAPAEPMNEPTLTPTPTSTPAEPAFQAPHQSPAPYGQPVSNNGQKRQKTVENGEPRDNSAAGAARRAAATEPKRGRAPLPTPPKAC